MILSPDIINRRRVLTAQLTHAGLSAQEIAARLDVAPRTVVRYRAQVRLGGQGGDRAAAR